MIEMSKSEETIFAKFREKFPAMKEEKALDLFIRYKSVCKKYLLRSSEQDISSFPRAKALDECKRFQYKKDSYWVWKEFGQGIPYIYPLTTGNNITKKLSTVKLDQRYIDALIQLEDDTGDVVNYYYDGIDLDKCEPVPIDIKSLQNYINTTQNEIQKKPYDYRLDTWKIQLRLAKKIKIIAKHFYNHYNDYILPQIYSPSDGGRMYFKGLSLHSTSKALRGACIGNATQYDLSAAAFAIRLILAQDIYEEEGLIWHGAYTHTKEYLEYKDTHRTRLGNLIFAYDSRKNKNKPSKDNEAGAKLVKQTLSAIGFGATTSTGSWKNEKGVRRYPALNSIIRNPEDRKRVLDDPWLKKFIEEQKEIHALITHSWNGKVKGQVSGDIIPKSKIMSHMFMVLETAIMDDVVAQIDGNKIITRVHDAVYTQKPLLQRELEEIRYTLNSYSPAGYLVLDKETNTAW